MTLAMRIILYIPILDIPTIISGEKVAYLEPQEKMWSGKPGRSYKLCYLQAHGTDALKPFEGIFGFDLTSSSYPYTLFRFPLRTVASDLSENIYTTEKVNKLIDALRDEAKLLLLFLRSVDSIEVYNISENGEQSLLFKACIADNCKNDVGRKRNRFKGDLQNAYQRQSFKVSSVIRYTSRFQVEITDCVASHSSMHDWLVVNQVGSQVHEVLEASPQQSAFPLVGAALELNDAPEGGRIFCFLPMPAETASGLPVHVNGTFGLTDDRRSLKWPGAERKNDPTANWNQLLIKELLHFCYLTLVIEARSYLKPEHFYNIWPAVTSICGTQWNVFLEPFFTQLFLEPIVFSEMSRKWVTVAQQSTVFVPCGKNLPPIVLTVLSSCGFNVVTVPSVVWEALEYVQTAITKVTPSLVRNELHSKPQSYTHISTIAKRNLLMYCLSDNQYFDLQGIELIPLANGKFTSFQSIHQYGASCVYLCSSKFPKHLLPNLDHKLVNISNDPPLQSSLYEIANEKITNLYPLTDESVATLLSEAMPYEWKKSGEVSLPHYGFPSTWFEKFWDWIRDRDLEHFKDELIVPISSPRKQPHNTFRVVRLSAIQSPLYIPSYQQCSSPLQNALSKLQVRYTMQQHFPYLSHRQLLTYLKEYDPSNLLNAAHVAMHYIGVNFLEDEAEDLQAFLCSSSYMSFTFEQKSVLKNFSIFKAAANSIRVLSSVAQAASNSIATKALLLEANFNLSVTNLPSNLILFTQSSHYQATILQQYVNVASISDVDLLVKHIFPLIQTGSFPSHLVNPLMNEVLNMFYIFQSKNPGFAGKVQNLPFLDTGLGFRECPKNTFDPSVQILTKLYKGKKVFPLKPFNRPKYLQVLRQCGLHTTVTPQEVVNIVTEIRTASSSLPKQFDDDQLKLSRSKATLHHIGSNEFQQRYSSECKISGIKHTFTFKSALNHLAKGFSWLPIMADPPAHYPSNLPWRGRSYNGYVISLNSAVVVVGPNDVKNVSCLVGSQMFIVSVDSQAVVDLFKKHKLTNHVLAHFEEIIRCMEKLQADVLNQLVINVYSYLKDVLSDWDLNRLYDIQKWIYLKKHNKFVSPNMVALNQNPTFRHNLEPYFYIQPESLSEYSALFTRFGVKMYMTQSQILSVLESIKNNSSSPINETDRSNAWDIVMSILNWITNNGTKQVSLSSNETLYVPIESESMWPQLTDSNNVVYTDNDFLKDFLMSCGSDETYTFVNSRVSQKMAECLGLTPLSEYLDISEDSFEDSGQHEPLKVRLKNILREYKDGLTIVKELLQNADDAEATEVNICYDARTHTVPPKSLFFPGMLESHGPALLLHNNRSFTEEDFKNITKLAGATKQGKQLKIGKFGVGFCSVYHITDVPSFVSEDRLCIFDPTLSVLQKEVKNPSQPGKKVKFTSKFIARSSQLLPYEGLFGFQPGKPYQGTLFRFPFRSSASELSGTCYTEATVKELMSDIQKCGSKLLLFLQHVKRITFQVIAAGEQTPTVQLTINKESVDQPIRTTNTCTEKVRCDIKVHPQQTHVENWLITSDSSVINERNATASIACQLDPAPTTSNYSSIVELDGELFCYLPLSQKTGLPVHVSGNFAVINNRRGIWTADYATSKTDPEVEWNEALMQNVIPKAYFYLISELQDMHQHNLLQAYVFYSLWPLTSKLLLHNPWYLMVDELYRRISAASDSLFYSSCSEMWLTLNESKFLQHEILSHTSISETPKCITEIVSYLKLPIVNLPEEYRVHFPLSEHIITEKLFVQLYFENLNNLSEDCESRNLVIIHMLEVYAAEYDEKTSRCDTLGEYFNTHACVPCTPDGTTLRHCDNVISLNAPFAALFDPTEARFPIKEFLERHLVYSALCKLGMMCDVLPWKLLIERAQTVSTLYNRDKAKALNRAELIIRTLNDHKIDPRSPATSGPTIYSVEFLPVLAKPFDSQLPWYGQGCHLSSGQNMLIAGTMERNGSQGFRNAIISGSQVKFVCENTPEYGGCGHITTDTLKHLHIRTSPTCEEVIKHLKLLADSKDMTEQCDQLCRHVYEFFDDVIGDSEPSEAEPSISASSSLRELFTFACIWNGETFLERSSIAKQWKMNGPYLYPVPASLGCRQRLSMFLNIKDDFSVEDVQQALIRMKKDFGGVPVSEHCQTFLKELVPILENVETDQFSDFKIVLPDENFVLHWSTDLAYNDAPWAPKDASYTYVNKFISRALAEKLHVRKVRSKFLEKYVSPAATHFNVSGVPFGQKEELTRRISNIIRDYPFDVTVLKELLQNADDAKATKMYIILDKRTHGTESVLSEEWQKLQGPALLVWNDSTFSEEDLKGIQELGLGNKRSDAESIGQYGIGFNVVYHLTDCPSFVTGGETLCIMDPHCKFVEDADPMKPGRRFDNLNSGLWEIFPDVKSAYLQSNLENSPPELSGGSLFRFPLRCTDDLVQSSEIVKDSKSQPLTADEMHRLLSTWAPQMKVAMLFLNHVTELKFCVIEKCEEVIMTGNHFRTTVNSSDYEKRVRFHECISKFKNQTGETAHVVMYPLTMSDIKNSGTTKQKAVEEKWLIQQGVGDIDNNQQEWKFVKKLKPRHGIASPVPPITSSKSSISRHTDLEDYVRSRQTRGSGEQKSIETPLVTVMKLPQSKEATSSMNRDLRVGSTSAATTTKFEQPLSKESETVKDFSGQVFCFLPLPLESKLPVHINGNFMLSSNRRDLWHTTTPEEVDERSKWNDSLISALASSYAKFLVDCQHYYIIEPDYFASIKNYYQLFPRLKSTAFNQPWLQLATSVYRKLYKNNSTCLAVVEQQADKPTVIHWCRPTSSSLMQQVYIWKSRDLFYEHDYKVIRPILRKLGMIISSAPYRIRKCFDAIVDKKEQGLPDITPSSVYDYYKMITSLQVPCAIEATPFETLSNFKAFTEYLLKCNPEKHIHEFPSDPYETPLLLTNDGILRCFKEHLKVIVSEYCQLFPKSSDRFLHLKLIDVNYNGEYFVQCSPLTEDDDSHQEGLKLVFEILVKILPPCIKATDSVDNYTEYFTKHILTSLWECLANDPTFQFYLSDILKDWALLVTEDSRLFSSQSSVLPVIPPEQEDPNIFVCELFCEMEMPFLDTSIVVSDSTNCPQLDEHTRILENIFCLHQRKDLSKLLTREKVQILTRYLKKIDFRNDDSSRIRVKSLPLFETAEGQFSSIQGKYAYIWPHYVCKSGYQKWLTDSDAIFVMQYGNWTELGSAEQLGIRSISPEYLYVKFVFPNFHFMAQTERYTHLRYIRDSLFDTVMVNMEKQVSEYDESKVEAERFFREIQSLCCLGGDNEALRPVTYFYSHKERIFLTFEDNFLFLPEYFSKSCTEDESTQWLKFFTKFGLHKAPTTEEYLQLCKKVAKGQTSSLREASATLTNYIFSKKAWKLGWHNDYTFLHKVSQIPFVCSKLVLNLAWIKPTVSSTNRITIKDEVIEMARFCDAVTDIFEDHTILLWTVKPVVQLSMAYNNEHRLLRSLNVCMLPCVQDVIHNIENICESSPFANIKLFCNYPRSLKIPNNGTHLLKVMETNFNFLEKDFKSLTEKDIELLRDLPCVPVYSTPNAIRTWQLVLVKPRYVLKCDMQEYHPFLHALPDDLYSAKQLLAKIGVENAIELSHMQLVLELAFKSAEQQDVGKNTNKCVQAALKDLFHILQREHSKPKDQRMTESSIQKALYPLYLPSEGRKVTLSTQLVYRDKPNYGDTLELSFGELTLTLLDLPVLEYGFYESHFCQLLPKSVRPLGLSEICEQTVDTNCKMVSDCIIADQLKQALSVPMLAKATMSVVKHYVQNEDACSDLEPPIGAFLSSIRVITVQNMETEIRHKESRVVIGKGKVDFLFFDSESEGRTLYVDSHISNIMKEYVVKELAEALLSQIKQLFPEIEMQTAAKIQEIFTYFLKAESPSDIREILNREEIAIDHGGFAMDTIKWELGRVVPECWHHRLDQDDDNIFTPMEYVGYFMNGRIIIAQIVHAVLPPGVESFGFISPHTMSYKIYTSQDDDEGMDAKAFDLFKFLGGLTKPTHDSNKKSTAVKVYEGATGTSTQSIDSAELKTCRKEIDRTLREIWKLPQDEKMRALRRLYLKWHPDKNLDNVQFAEDIFKYLVSQIELLDKTSSNEEPLYDSYSPGQRGTWQQTFDQWNKTAHQHSFFSQRENSNGDGENFEDRGHTSSHSENVFASSPFCFKFQPKKDPQEGQRWVRQAVVDFRALYDLHHQLATYPQLSGHVCFMAHQVAEKALKGAMYAECGLDGMALIDHKLTRHACALQQLHTQTLGLTMHVAPLENYYLDTRYPNRCPSHKIPAEMFEVSEADSAKEHAHQVLKIVQQLITQQNS